MTVRQLKESMWTYLKEGGHSNASITEKWEWVISTAKDPSLVVHEKYYWADFTATKFKDLEELCRALVVFLNGRNTYYDVLVSMKVNSRFTKEAMKLPVEEALNMKRLLGFISPDKWAKILSPELRDKYLKAETRTRTCTVWNQAVRP